MKYDRLALLRARPQKQNSSFPQPAPWQHKLLNPECRNREALVHLCGLGERNNKTLGHPEQRAENISAPVTCGSFKETLNTSA